MNDRYQGFRIGGAGNGQPHGPVAVVARIIGAIAAVGLFALSLFLGAFVLVAVVAAAIVGAVVFRIWYWWQTRQMRRGKGNAKVHSLGGEGRGPFQGPGRAGTSADTRPHRSGEGDVVEGEFEVVDEDDEGAKAQDSGTRRENRHGASGPR